MSPSSGLPQYPHEVSLMPIPDGLLVPPQFFLKRQVSWKRVKKTTLRPNTQPTQNGFQLFLNF